MILDTVNGVVIDFVPFEWTPAELASLNVLLGGWTITAADVSWTGATGISCAAMSYARSGSDDHDDATDFACGAVTPGVQNPGLIPPFSSCGGGGCPSARASKVVNVYTLPPLFLGNDTIIGSPNSITLNAGTGFSSYLWSTSATSQTITVSTTNNYWVTVTDNNGCHNTDTIHVDVLTNAQEALLDKSISFFPNPVTNELTVTIAFSNMPGKVTVNLCDELGRKIQEKSISAHGQNRTITLDLSACSKGMYYLEFRNEKASIMKKLVKL